MIVVFALELDHEKSIRISAESKEMRFFSAEELEKIDIVITHSDIVEDWFLNAKKEMRQVTYENKTNSLREKLDPL